MKRQTYQNIKILGDILQATPDDFLKAWLATFTDGPSWGELEVLRQRWNATSGIIHKTTHETVTELAAKMLRGAIEPIERRVEMIEQR